MGKDVGFWVEAPVGGLVASFSAFDPELGCDEGGDLEVFLFADSQAAIKQRARELGVPSPGPKRDKDSTWVTATDVEAAVSSEDGAVWRWARDWDPPGQYRNIRDRPGTYEQPRR
ncbi:MAG: hypothetical protein ACRDQD_32500 [Nocardioidaceae bacterium]